MKSGMRGLGKKERARLSAVLRKAGHIITPAAAATALSLPRDRASQLLAIWCKKGWLSRVRRGVYVPVSLQSSTGDVMVDEPWLVARTIFSPCYIGGWSAAEHWDFTEQIFNSVMVVTTKSVRERVLSLRGVRFQLKTVEESRLFGTKQVWINNETVEVSDPTKTIVDVLNNPAMAGGIRMVTDFLEKYLRSEHRNFLLIRQYCDRIGNRAVYKRLGFLLERMEPKEKEMIGLCRKRIKSGYSQLDPGTPGKALITKWGLWIPPGWKQGIPE